MSMYLGNQTRVVPYYLFYLNALLLLLIWATVTPFTATFVFGPALILAGLYVVGYFDLRSVHTHLHVVVRVFLAHVPAILFLSLLEAFGRERTPWLSSLAIFGSGILTSSLLWYFVAPVLTARSQWVIVWVDGWISEQSDLLNEISAYSHGHIRFRMQSSPNENAPKLNSRAGNHQFPGRVYRYRHDRPDEPAAVPILVDFRRLCETTIRRIPVDLAISYEDGQWRDPATRLDRFLMRALDIAISVVALLLFLPLLILAAAAIWLEDGLPFVLAQTRIGKGGLPFTMYKFRTMRQAGFDAQNPNGNMSSRILRSGRILRKMHIDEIPQFFNVLRGTMSIVGARPELPVYHERGRREIPCYDRRLSVRPGLTGWAQTRYFHTTSLDEYRMKTSYDLWYIRNRSVWRYLSITISTLRTVIFHTGR